MCPHAIGLGISRGLVKVPPGHDISIVGDARAGPGRPPTIIPKNMVGPLASRKTWLISIEKTPCHLVPPPCKFQALQRDNKPKKVIKGSGIDLDAAQKEQNRRRSQTPGLTARANSSGKDQSKSGSQGTKRRVAAIPNPDNQQRAKTMKTSEPNSEPNPYTGPGYKKRSRGGSSRGCAGADGGGGGGGGGGGEGGGGGGG